AVGEIAELGFPQGQGIRLGGRIAVFIAEHGYFREHGIEDLVARLPVAQMIEGRAARLWFLVEQDRLPLRGATAFALLSREAHRMTFFQQGAEGERFRGGPVDALAAFDRLAAIVEETLDGAVRVEILRERGDLAADLLQRIDLDAGIAAARLVDLAARLQSGPATVKPVGLVRLVALAGFVLGFQPRTPVGLHLVDFAFGDDAFADQLPRIEIKGRGMRPDLLVHQGLGESRLVAFVVTEAA